MEHEICIQCGAEVPPGRSLYHVAERRQFVHPARKRTLWNVQLLRRTNLACEKRFGDSDTALCGGMLYQSLHALQNNAAD